MTGSEKLAPVHLSHIMTGLIAALAMDGIQVLSARRNRIDFAMAHLYKDIKKEAADLKLLPMFHITTHPIHGDSPAVREGLYKAAQRNLLSFDNPAFQDVRIKISAEEAPIYLERLPGDRAMYERLAKQFLRYYERFVPGQTAAAAT